MLRFQQIDNQNNRRVGEACTVESVTWTNSRWHFQRGNGYRGRKLTLQGIRTGWVLLQGFLGSIRTYAAEHPHMKCSVANPID